MFSAPAKTMNNVSTCDILGVQIAAVNMPQLVAFTTENIEALRGEYICAANVHTTVTAYRDPAYRVVQNGAALAIPDGGPLSTLGHSRGYTKMQRTTGPTYMTEMLLASKGTGYRHYFYGATEDTLARMRDTLQADYPWVKIAGMYSPPFRPLTQEEDAQVTAMINEARPDFIWVGLGAPKQEFWMAQHKGRVTGLMVGVGAAFDYLAGNLQRAPKWMQDHDLEWFFRLIQEPARLFSRYMGTNLTFIWHAIIKRR